MSNLRLDLKNKVEANNYRSPSWKNKRSLIWNKRTPIDRVNVMKKFLERGLTFLVSKFNDKHILNFGLFIINKFINDFTAPNSNFIHSYMCFGALFYKKIRGLQSFIIYLRSKIQGFFNLNALKYINQDSYITIYDNITLYNTDSNKSLDNTFDSKVEKLFSLTSTRFKDYLDLKEKFGIVINFSKNDSNIFHTYLFIICLRLYHIEKRLQWLNTRLFKPANSDPYIFKIPYSITSFFKKVHIYGYDRLREWKFKVNSKHGDANKFKFKKKWRFWREFKRSLLYDKSHLLIRFKWLHNHKRILNQQYLSTYSINIQSKLKKVYNKKVSKAKFFSFLFNLEYRLDILSMRVFQIRSTKWVWLLLYFGYLTVNLNKKNRFYILKQGDILFGWLLLKNYKFFRKLRAYFRKPHLVYSYLEYEPSIKTFICLSSPFKYSSIFNDRNRLTTNLNRLITKKYIKYTFLRTY